MSQKAKFVIKSSLNDIYISVNPDIYEKLLNIGRAFALDISILQMLKTDKDSIVAEAKKIDRVFRYLPQTSSWKSHYAVISGTYIYFYESNRQPTPSAYFYLVNTVITKSKLSDKDDLFILSVSPIRHSRSKTTLRSYRSA
jgi:hypothetical protein